MGKNASLHNAKSAKNDEFYTQYNDIATELKHYKEHFEGKVVMCNCDDPLESNFTKYFILNFNELKLKKLICTFYDVNNIRKAYAFEYEGEDINNDGVINAKDIEAIRVSNMFRTPLADDEGFNHENKDECWEKNIYGSGDFRSKDVISYLKTADIVVTNPPFSLFREYVAQLMEYDKKFIIIGNGNAVTYKEIFPLIKENKIWWGVSLGMTKCHFIVPDTYEGKNTYIENGVKYGMVNNAMWFTNLTHAKRNTPLDLYKKYSNENYPKYDNYDAIEVSKVTKIPMDYDGVMGVPITFLDKYCPEQFEIIGHEHDLLGDGGSEHIGQFEVNGKGTYKRILIKRK